MLALLALLRMPLRTSVQGAVAYQAMQHDKKRFGCKLRFVLPDAIGKVSYGIEAPRRDVLAVLRDMNAPFLSS